MNHGLLLVDKDPKCTSHDVVQGVRRLFRQKRVGHCGTLDPDATGLLLLTLGQATRLTRFLIRAPKVYEGALTFGVATDTYDASGEVVAEASAEGLELAIVAEAMASFEGVIDQAPPPYSAKKVGGVRFYELARKGEEVPQDQHKQVEVFEFRPEGELEEASLRFRLACSSGTYARTLAHETGIKVGTGAHLSALRRLQVGGFRVEDALSLEEIGRRFETLRDDPADPPGDPAAVLAAAWIPFDEIPLPFAEVTADSQQERRIVHGQTALIRDLPGEEGDWVKLTNRRQQFIAVGTVVERIGEAGVGIVQPRVVFR
jgi:tRNA pseudouridine55 synthase